MPGTSCVKQTSWSYVVKFQSIIKGFKLHAVVISIRFLFLGVNAESVWNVARINGMIKMPYPVSDNVFGLQQGFLNFDSFMNFLCLPDHDNSAEDWWWQVDLWPSIQRTAWYPAQTRDRYCAKCSRATKGKSLTEFLENLFWAFQGTIFNWLKMTAF